MSWIRLDDRYAHHPKILAAGPMAMALDVAGMCYAAAHCTDGHIPRLALPLLAPVLSPAKQQAAAATLVEVGRWEPVADGWQIHDFLAYNPSAAEREAKREEVERRRAADRQRKRAERSRPPDVRADKPRTSGRTERGRPNDVRPPPHPHPRPASGGDGGGAFPSPPDPPSVPASPEPSPPVSDSAGQTHPRPALMLVNRDPGDPPNGQVPQLSAALKAQVSAALDAELGPDWRRKVAPQTGQSPEEFEAERAQKLAEFEAKFAQELRQTEAETEPEPSEVEPQDRADEAPP